MDLDEMFPKEEAKVEEPIYPLEELVPVEKKELTDHEVQLLVVKHLTDKLAEAANGRTESIIGLEEPYWQIRNKLSHAHVRAEELRPK